MKEFLVELVHKEDVLISLPAEAENFQELRSKYSAMFRNASFHKDMQVKVYVKEDDKYRLIEDMLF